MEIAVSEGFLYGAQLPGTIYPDIAPLWFTDQNWKKPNRESYIKLISKYKPVQATVLDIEREEQFDEVMEWAEEVAQYVQRVVIIPKAHNIIKRIPNKVGNATVILGYSVPTKYAGTEIPMWEFEDRPVHLLGGSPKKQLEATYYLNVSSADGNYMSMKALRFCEYWNGTKWIADGNENENDVPYIVFRKSCETFRQQWTDRFMVDKSH